MNVLWSFSKFISPKLFYMKYSFDFDALVKEVQESYRKVTQEQHQPVSCALVEQYLIGVPDDMKDDAQEIAFFACHQGEFDVEITGLDEDDEPTRRFVIVEEN